MEPARRHWGPHRSGDNALSSGESVRSEQARGWRHSTPALSYCDSR